MSSFQPPPTYAEVVIVDPVTKKGIFNPIWLNWFLNLVKNLNPSGSGSVTSVTVAAANNGLSAAFANATSTPALIIGIGTVQPATAYNAVDGSPGISTTVTTASLVGKTITVKNGLITGFS